MMYAETIRKAVEGKPGISVAVWDDDGCARIDCTDGQTVGHQGKNALDGFRRAFRSLNEHNKAKYRSILVSLREPDHERRSILVGTLADCGWTIEGDLAIMYSPCARFQCLLSLPKECGSYLDSLVSRAYLYDQESHEETLLCMSADTDHIEVVLKLLRQVQGIQEFHDFSSGVDQTIYHLEIKG